MGKIAAGCTVAQTECRSDPAADEAMPPHSWSQVKADKFNVRQGPDYGLQKRKARSVGPPLYQLCGVDWYRSGSRLEGVGGLADLPRAEFSHPSVPSLLIVNVQLPLEGPSLLKGAKDDGPTVHAVFHFCLRQETAQALSNLESAQPSVRLVAAYFRRAESEPDVRKRIKALAFLNNPDAINMHRLVQPFNGKPVLITESGSLMRGSRAPGGEGTFDRRETRADADEVGRTTAHVAGGAGEAIVGGSGDGDGRAVRGRGSGVSFEANEFLELDINVRKWSYLARKGLHKLAPKFGSINVSVAFLIEGREDDELPEQVLGCGTLNMLEIESARDIQGSS